MADVVGSVWRTPMFSALMTPLDRVLGAKTAKPFEALHISTVGDLLRHVPRHLLSGTEASSLSDLPFGEHVAVLARVKSAEVKGAPPKRRVEVILTDGQGTLRLAFFSGKQFIVDNWVRQLTAGGLGIFVGKVGSFNGEPQFTHPDFVMLSADGTPLGKARRADIAAQVNRAGLIGLYPQTAKLPTWTIGESARLLLHNVDGLADPLPDWVRAEADVPELTHAFAAIHEPANREQHAAAKRRLLFDEAFGTQVAMAYRRQDAARSGAVPRVRRPDGILAAFDAALSLTLTSQQAGVGDEIFADLARPRPMQRLLQGEVGSGKTLVALRAMLTVVDTGGQAALLAPTEVLAAQHLQSIRALLGDLGGGRVLGAPDLATDVVLLTGSQRSAERKSALLKAASGEAGIVIGTHALLGDRVQFADLGLIVIDEQHRFGVEQRAVLGAKADAHPHVLVLTATPIPRSVAMTVFGDLEVSTLRELPRGRGEVSTTVVDQARNPAWVERVWQRIAEEAAAGRQAFVVAPRISLTDADDGLAAAAVEDVHARLTAGPLAGLGVGILHGRLPSDEKDATMRAFASGDLDVLVATTVIEVGVDVPNATMMVILDADRFGISQLHQLRGRVGRGRHHGLCLLVTRAQPGTPARERLDAVAATRDGFALAEVDLAQRREGDVLGLRQSGGRSSLRLLRVLEHADEIAIARTLAEKAVADDPEMTDPGIADYVTQIERIAADDWAEGG